MISIELAESEHGCRGLERVVGGRGQLGIFWAGGAWADCAQERVGPDSDPPPRQPVVNHIIKMWLL